MINEIYKTLTDKEAPLEHDGIIILEGSHKTNKRWCEIGNIEDILDLGHIHTDVILSLHKEHSGGGGCFASLHINSFGDQKYYMISMSEKHMDAKDYANDLLPKNTHLHTRFKGPKNVVEAIKNYLSSYPGHSPRDNTSCKK